MGPRWEPYIFCSISPLKHGQNGIFGPFLGITGRLWLQNVENSKNWPNCTEPGIENTFLISAISWVRRLVSGWRDCRYNLQLAITWAWVSLVSRSPVLVFSLVWTSLRARSLTTSSPVCTWYAPKQKTIWGDFQPRITPPITIGTSTIGLTSQVGSKGPWTVVQPGPWTVDQMI